jgi:uncharacterized protein YdcH (DUF465 family)
MINIQPYIDEIKKELNVPSSYMPNIYKQGSNSIVKFQLTMEQLPDTFNFVRTVISPSSLVFDCSFTLPDEITASNVIDCQIMYWEFKGIVNPNSQFGSHWELKKFKELKTANEQLPPENRKYLERHYFRQIKTEPFTLDNIVNKFKQNLEEYRKKLYCIIKIAEDPIYDEFFNQVKEIENRIHQLECNKDDIYEKITKQLKKDISIYEEFEL